MTDIPWLSHRHIEVFSAIMTAGGVSGAARLLHSSQPTISRELARAEQLVGYALFERQRGRLRATARALALFEEVQRSYHGLARVRERAAELARAAQQQLGVLAQPSLAHALLPAACARVLARFPESRIAVTPQESPLLEEWMAAQRFDLGLTELGPVDEGTVPRSPAQSATTRRSRNQAGSSIAPGTQTIPLLTLDEVCVLPAGHALLAKQRLAPRDFAGQAFVSLAPGDPYRAQIDRIFEQAGVARRLVAETHSAVAVCAMVQAGLGLAVVNPLTALACAGVGLRLRRFSASIPYRVCALRPLHRPAQALADELIAALRDEAQALKEKLAPQLRQG